MQKKQTKKRKEVINIKKTIEDKFLYNDGITATAGKFLLAAVLAAPLFVVAAAAPNILSGMGKFKKHKKYSKKQIQTAFNNLKQRKLIEIIKIGKEKYEVRLTNKGQKRIKEFSFVPLPHNEDYELDLHRPYIDAIEFDCAKCEKGRMKRVKDVVDVWFDSGS
ncbi:MAG: isoleucyl-tRNA ligase, partial [Candidatus Moranbacteria bacterium GW2011_GWF1_36_4]